MDDPSSQAVLAKAGISLDMEKADPLKANTFSIKFLAFKTPFNIVDVQVPKRMYFVFKFFVFPQFSTERVVVADTQKRID